MKKLLFISLLMAGITAGAQSTFRVLKHNTTVSVTPNAVIDAVTTPTDLTTTTFDILNTGNTTHTYNVTRYDQVIYTISNDDKAEARFCFASQCYGANVVTGVFSLTLTPGANTSTLGSYYSLDCDLFEASRQGYSLVKYTVYNENQRNDSLQFTMRYNAALQFVGIKENGLNAQILQILPNPAKNFANLNVVTATSSEAEVSIINSIGQKVYEQKIVLHSGKNTIPLNLSQLPAGVYFAQVSDGKQLSTRKLIIE